MKKTNEKNNARRLTSVEFEEWIRPVADRVISIYGLKPAVSAGLYLLASLSAEEQIRAISAVKRIGREYSALIDEFLAELNSVKHTEELTAQGELDRAAQEKAHRLFERAKRKTPRPEQERG